MFSGNRPGSRLRQIGRVAGESIPSLFGAASAAMTGGNLPGVALTAGAAQGGHAAGRRLFRDRFGNSEFFDNLAEQVNARAIDRFDASDSARVPVLVSGGDMAERMGGYVGGAGGTIAGLVGTNLLQNVIFPQRPTPEVVMPQPVMPQQGMPQQAMPVMAGEMVAGSPVGPGVLTPLNAEQIKRAQTRAAEQAALNAYYAQSLSAYPVQ